MKDIDKENKRFLYGRLQQLLENYNEGLSSQMLAMELVMKREYKWNSDFHILIDETLEELVDEGKIDKDEAFGIAYYRYPHEKKEKYRQMNTFRHG